jgi:predicted small metal-binding protein
MKTYECGTLVPGCDWSVTDESEAEIVRRAVDHMRSAHGETLIRENMVENIKQRIKPAKQNAA